MLPACAPLEHLEASDEMSCMLKRSAGLGFRIMGLSGYGYKYRDCGVGICIVTLTKP